MRTNRTSSPIQLPLPLDGETIEIPLTQGYVTIVDAIDADLAQYKWHILQNGYGVYAIGWLTTYDENSNRIRRKYQLHRIILSRMLDRELSVSELVDHVDCNGLNNTRENLRLSTPTLNNANQRIRKDSKSRLKGAIFDRNKWRAVIRFKGETIRLGRFDTPEEAHEAYCKAAKELYGDFARFN